MLDFTIHENKDKLIKTMAEKLFNFQNCPPGCEKYKDCSFGKDIAINCWIAWAKRKIESQVKNGTGSGKL